MTILWKSGEDSVGLGSVSGWVAFGTERICCRCETTFALEFDCVWFTWLQLCFVNTRVFDTIASVCWRDLFWYDCRWGKTQILVRNEARLTCHTVIACPIVLYTSVLNTLVVSACEVVLTFKVIETEQTLTFLSFTTLLQRRQFALCFQLILRCLLLMRAAEKANVAIRVKFTFGCLWCETAALFEWTVSTQALVVLVTSRARVTACYLLVRIWHTSVQATVAVLAKRTLF